MEFNFDNFTDEDWLLSQHCDYEIAFQKEALSIIEKYLSKEHSYYKWLYDRIWS
jgi:hypothetical protein